VDDYNDSADGEVIPKGLDFGRIVGVMA